MVKKILFTVLMKHAKKLAQEFENASKDVRKTQQNVLLKKIRSHQESDFGKTYGFKNITDIASYRKNLPVSDYARFYPYIERVKKGDLGALFGKGAKVIMFALTSGTTREPKYIPVTHTFLQDYRRGWFVWGHYVYTDYPAIIDKTFFPITSAYDEFCTDKGVPCGAISGLSAEKQSCIAKLIYSVPSRVYKVRDVSSKYYLMMRIAISKDVRSLTTANPSTILTLVKLVAAQKETFVRDIHDGTISDHIQISSELRDSLKKCIRPNKKRAYELERCIAKSGDLLPKDYWPHMALLCNWKGGALSTYLDSYPHYFGDTPVRDIGLVASEGRMSIPMDNNGANGVLDIQSQFFEFIPEEEASKENPTVLTADELIVDKKYFILLTTSSGLYRYNIHDLVEVTGFYHEAPIIRFLNKGKHISSMTGEKVTEFQVVESVRESAHTCGVDIDTFTFIPCPGERPYYTFVIEEHKIARDEIAKRLIGEIDKNLKKMNMEYEGKRKSHRIFNPTVSIVPNGAFDTIKKDHTEKQKGRVEQYKNVFLSSDNEYMKAFDIIREISYNGGSL
ncbi:MAG: GH3 auxin-responsive promoter family protein [Candidatus Ancaeobacter aquaticus]|nr:GH3 auxin-responsive promoter family protein [Candidatus Ancaeobacter aquaticus]